jgi:hypothetical protein
MGWKRCRCLQNKEKSIKLFENHKVKIDIIGLILVHSILQWDGRGVGACKIKKKNIKLFENHKVKIDITGLILFHSILQLTNKQAHKQTWLRGIRRGHKKCFYCLYSQYKYIQH